MHDPVRLLPVWCPSFVEDEGLSHADELVLVVHRLVSPGGLPEPGHRCPVIANELLVCGMEPESWRNTRFHGFHRLHPIRQHYINKDNAIKRKLFDGLVLHGLCPNKHGDKWLTFARGESTRLLSEGNLKRRTRWGCGGIKKGKMEGAEVDFSEDRPAEEELKRRKLGSPRLTPFSTYLMRPGVKFLDLDDPSSNPRQSEASQPLEREARRPRKWDDAGRRRHLVHFGRGGPHFPASNPMMSSRPHHYGVTTTTLPSATRTTQLDMAVTDPDRR
ncbi:hypothetical protein BHE74_00016404 [Ensete ventricosum]|nr:hypothetical protein GW17_00046735 [Ensete ventricosum]RWW75577.1 hypothetical protein BHE74_00016404 [Ensete ventricosum]